MRRFVLVVFGAAMAGCAGGAGGSDEAMIDPALYDEVRTSELGTDLTRGPSKKIEWQQIGTEEGASYCGGAVIVDQIVRHDVENFYNVSVRLSDTKNEVEKLEWQIRFYSLQGDPMLGFNEPDTWKPILIEPAGCATVRESARVKGAVGFRLFVRKAGDKVAGLQDPVEEP